MIDAELPEVSHAVERSIACWRSFVGLIEDGANGVESTHGGYRVGRRGHDLIVRIDASVTPWSGEPFRCDSTFRFPDDEPADEIGRVVLATLCGDACKGLGLDPDAIDVRCKLATCRGLYQGLAAAGLSAADFAPVSERN